MFNLSKKKTGIVAGMPEPEARMFECPFKNLTCQGSRCHGWMTTKHINEGMPDAYRFGYCILIKEMSDD